MKNITYHINCSKCGTTTGTILYQIKDYQKEKVQHIYRCNKCKRIVRKEFDVKPKDPTS